MTSASKIEWTDATWNPIVGCSLVSPGCTNCYAMAMAARVQRMTPASHYAGTTRVSGDRPVWTGVVKQAPERIRLAPLHWKKPRKIFVNSMSDLFHESVPDAWIDEIFAIMALCPQHTFQILTKRPARMRKWFSGNEDEGDAFTRMVASDPPISDMEGEWANVIDGGWPLPNVWLGVSAEDQASADARIPDLLATPAAVRFVSAEPMLGAVDLHEVIPSPLAWNVAHGFDGLNWVICGGESGPGARPMHPDWARSLRDQCAQAGVPFFFKQWGEWSPISPHPIPVPSGELREMIVSSSSDRARVGQRTFLAGQGDRCENIERVGKKRAGRWLDGREWNEFPETRK